MRHSKRQLILFPLEVRFWQRVSSPNSDSCWPAEYRQSVLTNPLYAKKIWHGFLWISCRLLPGYDAESITASILQGSRSVSHKQEMRCGSEFYWKHMTDEIPSLYNTISFHYISFHYPPSSISSTKKHKKRRRTFFKSQHSKWWQYCHKAKDDNKTKVNDHLWVCCSCFLLFPGKQRSKSNL